MTVIQKKYINENLRGYPMVHYVLLYERQAVCHADLQFVRLAHLEQYFRVAVLCNVITPGSHRRKGFGSLLIAAISQDINSSQNDFGLLFCSPELKNFYSPGHWESFENASNRIGAPERYTPYLLLRMMLFASERAKACKLDFHHPLYLPHPF